MAAYSGRKHGVNVSHYIADLNKEPSAFELERSAEETLNFEDDLAQFTNAEFFDFEPGNFLDGNASQMEYNDGHDHDATKPDAAKAAGKPAGLEFVKGDFSMNNLYEVNSPTSPTVPMKRPADYSYPAHPAGPLPYHPAGGLPPQAAYPYPPTTTTPTGARPPHATLPGMSPDEATRAAAEEDKRRRNTAASARFRVKKKEREKALERKTQELEKQNQGLEQRIGQLETENEWLRGLVVEKNGVAVSGGVGGKAKREEEKRKKGVGTSKKDEKEKVVSANEDESS